MRFNFIEMDYLDITKPDGSFNPDYIVHAQILGKPQQEGPVVSAPLFSNAEKLVGALRHKFTNRYSDAEKAKIFALKAVAPSSWTARAMHGAEYERGGFEARMTDMCMRRDMQATSVSVSPNFDAKEHGYGAPYGKENDPEFVATLKTLRQIFAERAGAELPATMTQTVYVLAPKGKMRAACEMVDVLAKDGREDFTVMTHRGVGLSRAMAFASLTEEQKQRYAGAGNDPANYENCGWFDILHKVFFTTDKAMFDRVCQLAGVNNTNIAAPGLRAA